MSRTNLMRIFARAVLAPIGSRQSHIIRYLERRWAWAASAGQWDDLRAGIMGGDSGNNIWNTGKNTKCFPNINWATY